MDGPPLPLWERSDRSCDPGEGSLSADQNPSSAEKNPSSGTDCVRATFSHKGRRKGKLAENSSRVSAEKSSPARSEGKRAGVFSSVTFANDGSAFHAVTTVLLDDRGSIARLALPDHGTLADPIAVVVAVALANGDAGANRADPNANILSHGRRRQGADGCGSKQELLHFVLLPVQWESTSRAPRRSRRIRTKKAQIFKFVPKSNTEARKPRQS